MPSDTAAHDKYHSIRSTDLLFVYNDSAMLHMADTSEYVNQLGTQIVARVRLDGFFADGWSVSVSVPGVPTQVLTAPAEGGYLLFLYTLGCDPLAFTFDLIRPDGTVVQREHRTLRLTCME
jgi:hypothetical protein